MIRMETQTIKENHVAKRKYNKKPAELKGAASVKQEANQQNNEQQLMKIQDDTSLSDTPTQNLSSKKKLFEINVIYGDIDVEFTDITLRVKKCVDDVGQ